VLSNDFALPVVATYMAGPPGTEPSITKIGELPLGWGVFAFMAISAAALLIIASPGVFGWYKRNMALQYKKVGPWRDYLFGEKVYIILSLTAKALLAWQVFSATLAG
jgi:hypothetical protein